MGAHKLKFKIEIVVVTIGSPILLLRYWTKDELDRIFIAIQVFNTKSILRCEIPS